jgi:NosR/NirI family transcriptional regulator, nitrous oxide reductase regulator
MNKWIKISVFFGLVFLSSFVFAQQRFPKPEFGSEYTLPTPTTPEPRSVSLEYFDVIILIAVLALASLFVLKYRSRKGIFWLSVFSLIYFGFYRDGCICAIGAIQNVALSISDPNYTISITALSFFLIPLITTLFFGRTFCAAACPLGAIQDLVILKPMSLPAWLRKTLGIIPFVYLGLAVLYAVTKTDFIICRYDPFIGIFRMNAPFLMVVLGISFLLIGLFVARPYCRFFCPYGVLLNWMSRFSKWHLSITPAECTRCRLCTTSCPFNAIEEPVKEKDAIPAGLPFRRFIPYIILIPVWILLGGFTISRSSHILARLNQDVYLAEVMVAHPELNNDEKNIDIQTFLSSGKLLETQIRDAKVIQQKFSIGGWILGGFLGLIIGIKLVSELFINKKKEYQPYRADCYSCGRCMEYCPVKKEEKGAKKYI